MNLHPGNTKAETQESNTATAAAAAAAAARRWTVVAAAALSFACSSKSENRCVLGLFNNRLDYVIRTTDFFSNVVAADTLVYFLGGLQVVPDRVHAQLATPR